MSAISLTVKHGGTTLETDLDASTTISQLQAELERRTGLFPRQQKILCKGKVVSGLPSSTTLLQAGIASGSKLMLLAAQGGSTQPSQGQAALKTTQDARRQEMRRRLDEAAAQNPNASAAPPVNAMQARLATWRKTGIAALRDLKLAAVPPEAFSAAGAIRVLDLGGNQLTVLPPSISQLTSLQKLRLSINNMSDAGMPWEELASLQSLAVLALDSNKLTLLPPCLSQLTRLQKLTAEHNQIAQLPAAVGALTSLRALTLRGNRLTALPPALAECVALEEVDASSNPLQALPTELGRLTNLKVLLLDNTLVRTVPPAILTGCTSLATLSLHACPITAEALRKTTGFGDMEARRRGKHDKQLDMGVLLRGGGFDPGVDVEEWEHWKHG